MDYLSAINSGIEKTILTSTGQIPIDELEKMVSHFDKMTKLKHIDHTSLLINTLSHDESELRKKDEENIYSTFLRYLNTRIECFKNIIDNPGFITVKEQLMIKAQV